MVMLTAQKANAQIVAACCARCARHGVLRGMSVAHARALVPTESEDALVVEPYEPARDETALEAMANWAIRFTPIVAADPPDGLLLDVTGCERLYGSEPAILNQLAFAFSRLRLRARLACASTIGCAWAVARYGDREHTVIPDGDERDAIDPLPTESLRLDEEICHGLHEVNIDRVDQLLTIPRLELAARFDPLLLRRMDQALGRINEVIEPIRPREPVIVQRAFQGPVKNLEAILIASFELLTELADELLHREIGVTQLRCIFKRSDLPSLALDVRLSHPSRYAKHLWSLLKPKAETANIGFGIEELTLRAIHTERITHQQTASSFAPASHDDRLRDRAAGMLIDTLSQWLGSDCVLMVQVCESHRPERVTERTPAMGAHARGESRAALVEVDRPSILLAQPERIEVMAMTPDGPPIWMRWRGVTRSLIIAHGPERIAGEWWHGLTRSRNDRRTRDYFKVQDETGRWWWMFRNTAGTGDSWFLHGIWA
jgi:protein ImuB